MRPIERRLQRLEQALPRWPITVEDAKQRCLARLKVRIGDACGIPDHPVIVEAQARLIEDTPEQAAHPELMRQAAGVRDRLSAMRDEVARRPEVSHGTIP